METSKGESTGSAGFPNRFQRHLTAESTAALRAYTGREFQTAGDRPAMTETFLFVCEYSGSRGRGDLGDNSKCLGAMIK